MKTRQQKINYLAMRLKDRDMSVFKNASEEKIDRLYFIEKERERKEKKHGISNFL
jgi:hypothetical protein